MEIPVLIKSLKSSTLSSTSSELDISSCGVGSSVVEQLKHKAYMVVRGDVKFGPWGWPQNPSKCWMYLFLLFWRTCQIRKLFLVNIWSFVLLLLNGIIGQKNSTYSYLVLWSSSLYPDGNTSSSVISEAEHLELNQFSDGSNLPGSGKCCCRKVGTMGCVHWDTLSPWPSASGSPLRATFSIEYTWFKLSIAKKAIFSPLKAWYHVFHREFSIPPSESGRNRASQVYCPGRFFFQISESDLPQYIR